MKGPELILNAGENELAELRPLSPLFSAQNWQQKVAEDPVKLSEMKIEIIKNNFEKHQSDHKSSLFIRAEKSRIQNSPEESQYSYRDVPINNLCLMYNSLHTNLLN